MTDQNRQKPNLIRLLLILLIMGSCSTAALVVMGFPLGTNRETFEAVSFCFKNWDFLGDYDLLAECLDARVDIAQSDYENPDTEMPMVSEDSPWVSCDGNDILIQFYLDKRVSGDFQLTWLDDSSIEMYVLNSTVNEKSQLEFRYANPPANYGERNIVEINLSSNGAVAPLFYENYSRFDAIHWDVCVPLITDQSDSNPEPEESPYVPPVVEPPNNLDGTPVIINSTCVGKGAAKQLMVVFEFDQDVAGEYAALVADIPYQHTPVGDQPNRLFYFGTPPPQGPITIKLVSITDLAIAFEETYTPVVCGPQDKKDDGDGGYAPPSN